MRKRLDWRLARVSELLKESRIRGSHGKTAQKLTVKLYGKGVVPSRSAGGSESTIYFRRSSGQFILSKLDFLNGAFGIIPEELSGFESTSDLPAFDFISADLPNWFLETVRRPSFYKRFKHSAIGSRKANRVPVGEFLASVISVPDLAEQAAICEVFGLVDASINSTESLLKALSVTKNAVMRELLAKGTRRDEAPMRTLKKRWVLGRITEDVKAIPADWELVRLTSVAKLESGHTPSRKVPEYWDGQIPWISLQDAERLNALTINSTRETFGPEGLANSSARLLPAGTVVLQRTANIGLCSIMAREMTTSQHFANWVCGPKIAPEYLLQVFRHMGREWKRLDAGSVLPDIYMPTFKKLQVLLPPLAEQQQIAEVGAAFDLRIEAEKRALAELQNTRKALAQELLSGRLRLPKSMIDRFEDNAVKVVSA